MVDHIAASTNVQATGASTQDRNLSRRPTMAEIYMKALNDAVTLSSQALQVLNQLSQHTSISEAWLQQLSEPPDLNTPDAGSSTAIMRTGLKQANSDLSWLLDTMSPPKVDTAKVVQALASRMTADSVGIQPPVEQVIAQAEQGNTVPIMFVENLSVVADRNSTSASVERVALTTVDPSLMHTEGGASTPLVLDLSGQAKDVPESQLLPAEKNMRGESDTRSLIMIRQGGTALPEGTLHVRLDMLIPLR